MRPLTARHQIVGSDSSDILVFLVKGGNAPSERLLTPGYREMLGFK